MVRLQTDAPFYCFTDDASNINSEVNVISIDVTEYLTWENWWAAWWKIQMFVHPDISTYKRKIFFDLDVIIYNKLPDLTRKNFTLLDDSWWREPAHTPLNSSIVSWTGDISYVWKKFKSNEEFYLKRYNKGSDEFYYHEIIHYDTFPNICPSIRVNNFLYEKPKDYSICTLGQMHHLLEKGWTGWYSNYLLDR